MAAGRDQCTSRAGAQRHPFVGRTRELAALHTAFDAASGGDGSMWVVLGEPGIGKTSMCEELADFAAGRGGQVLIGNCYEKGAPTLPYLPFVQALRGYVLERPIAGLTDELGSEAAEVARIVPELTGRLGVQAPEHDTLDAEGHRDLEVDRAHQLAVALTGLQRTAHFGRIQLGGLTATEVQKLLTTLGLTETGIVVAELVQKRTDGNPLLVREVAHLVSDEWITRGASGQPNLAARTQVLSRLPEGLRDGIGKRLARLSPATYRLLTVGAVIGREVDLTILRNVAGFEEHEFIGALEDAVQAGLLQEYARPGAVEYQFTHALVRQTLYEDMVAPRRLRLDQQIARALEVHYTGRLQRHAAELAEHFAQSTDAGDLRKSINYLRLAARQAASVFAFGEAARKLSQALQLLDSFDPDATAERCDIDLELGEVLIPAGKPRLAVEEVAPRALAAAQALQDGRRASQAAQIALEACSGMEAQPLKHPPRFALGRNTLIRMPPQTATNVYTPTTPWAITSS